MLSATHFQQCVEKFVYVSLNFREAGNTQRNVLFDLLYTMFTNTDFLLKSTLFCVQVCHSYLVSDVVAV